MTETLTIEALNSTDMDACYAIRTEVFCGEQQVSREMEFDGLDAECRHYLAKLGDQAVGTARVRPLGDGSVKFERIAVHAPFRGQQVGRALMERAVARVPAFCMPNRPQRPSISNSDSRRKARHSSKPVFRMYA
jgi:predicted GNAT family N-acyltransferase